jgi:UTP--glucose-1-phosphate uridylyltransferase
VQLETAAGAAIKHFKNAHGINVPRSRFLPVKSCSDLLLIKSDIYSLEHGQLVISDERMFGTTPVIKLGDHFRKVHINLLSRNAGDLTELSSAIDSTIPGTLQENP